MSKLGLVDIYLVNVAGQVPEDVMYHMDRDLARRRLCELTGEDFGFDAGRWRQWFEDHPEVAEKHKFGSRF